ncbi:Epithelial splicing regulatory protein 2 [Sparganum proliferum]
MRRRRLVRDPRTTVLTSPVPLIGQSGSLPPGSTLFSPPGVPPYSSANCEIPHQRSHPGQVQQQQPQHLTPTGGQRGEQNPLIAAGGGGPAAPISLLGAPNMLPPHLRMFYLPEMAQVAWNPLDLLVKSRIPASTAAAAAAAGGSGGSVAGSGPARHPRTLVHLRGMPVEATVNDILNYLGIYWQFVALHGIHLVYTAAGEPSGEAFVHFVSEIAASLVVLGKQNQSFVTASGARSNVQLILTTQEETNEFVSIPGTQPPIKLVRSGEQSQQRRRRRRRRLQRKHNHDNLTTGTNAAVYFAFWSPCAAAVWTSVPLLIGQSDVLHADAEHPSHPNGDAEESLGYRTSSTFSGGSTYWKKFMKRFKSRLLANEPPTHLQSTSHLELSSSLPHLSSTTISPALNAHNLSSVQLDAPENRDWTEQAVFRCFLFFLSLSLSLRL